MTNKKTCPICNRLSMKFGYPGNDPEAGPAQWYCDLGSCQTEQWRQDEEERLASMTPEERAMIEEEERRLEEMYAEQAAAYENEEYPEFLEMLSPEEREAEMAEYTAFLQNGYSTVKN